MEIMFGLIQEMSVFAVAAYLFSKTPAFRPLSAGLLKPLDNISVYLFFTAITIMGTYLGLHVNGAIANTRAIGAVMAGLLAGPWMGLAVGITGGLHRFMLGGFTASACGISTTAEGLIGGLVFLWFRRKGQPDGIFNFKTAFATTFISEMVQMAIILIFAKPFSEAWELVQIIALPMMFANAAGAGLFVSIFKDSKNALDSYGAEFSRKALNIANKTLPVLSKGFNEQSAQTLAGVILSETGVGAVAITDRTHVMAFKGIGADHHLPQSNISSRKTLDCINSGEVIFIDGITEHYTCAIHENCPLGSALIVPLVLEKEVIGTIKMYEPKNRRFLGFNQSFGEGIAEVLSTQLMLSKYEEQKRLLTEAELKLMQAQVNPHFLFNTLNTIGAVVRSQPEKAKELINHLSIFFRSNLKRSSETATLAEEIEHIRSYLVIEEARFSDRLKVEIDIDDTLRQVAMPAFTIQPIVENAIKHGLSNILGDALIKITARAEDGRCIIRVEDNAGIWCESGKSRNGIGMNSVDTRIKNMFGGEYGLSVRCLEGSFTIVEIHLPVSKL
ncbi:sensor histidine kinase [Seleniivibrio woodruffii]|uniref:sensor histidine kinase n=1 Tax=Seleniivibrio woodruffii TaxID=1078050 RepID=UPI00240A7997|nr:sensor histidine kinase [Seleniivibrio woodruffii]